MHLKVSRAQARCSLGGDTVDFGGRGGGTFLSVLCPEGPRGRMSTHTEHVRIIGRMLELQLLSL